MILFQGYFKFGGSTTILFFEKDKVKIDEEVVDPDDIEMLEDLIMAAVNEAIRTVEENTTQQILAKLQEVIPLINQIAQSGTAGSVNGFSFVHGDDGSVMITYTPDGATEAEVAVFPKETTQKKISKATKEIADSLKIIAGKEDKA